MKKTVKQNDEKEKQYLNTIRGDWVWPNDINIYAEMFQCVIRTARRNFHPLIRNIFSFFGYLFFWKKKVTYYPEYTNNKLTIWGKIDT